MIVLDRGAVVTTGPGARALARGTVRQTAALVAAVVRQVLS